MINLELKPYKISYDYDGSKIINEDLFELLQSKESDKVKVTRLEKAIERAKRNCEIHSTLTPAKAESSTTVYLLVEEIMKNK